MLILRGRFCASSESRPHSPPQAEMAEFCPKRWLSSILQLRDRNRKPKRSKRQRISRRERGDNRFKSLASARPNISTKATAFLFRKIREGAGDQYHFANDLVWAGGPGYYIVR